MKRIHRNLLSVLSGILLSLPWLGFPGWIIFLAFIPLLYLDKFFIENRNEFKSVSFWGHAWLAFFLWNILTTWWIMHATELGAALAIFANSFIMSLVFWLAHTARRNMHSNLGYISLVVFWITFEYVHYHWDIEWPWLTLGNAFANQVYLIQWYEYTGVMGGSLWILSLNIILFKLSVELLNKTSIKYLRIDIISALLLLITPITLSVIMYLNYTEAENPKNIVILQPNIDPYSEEYDLVAENEKLQKSIHLARQKTSSETNFIIGPETLFENPSYWNEEELKTNHFINELNSFIHQYPNAEMVFGVSSYKLYTDEKTASITARRRNGIIYDMYNTALFLSRDNEQQIYHKTKLVVGVEKMPFMKYLGFLGDIVIDIGGTSNSLGRQGEPINFVSKDGVKVAPVICYESVFGSYVAEYVKKGAGLIFIITNDGWWKNTPGYKQHLSFARLRAIELRRSIARSANTGISCFINQRGDVLKATNWWKEDVIVGKLNVNDKNTFYARNGDYIARISSFIAVLLLLYLISQKLLQNNNQII